MVAPLQDRFSRPLRPPVPPPLSAPYRPGVNPLTPWLNLTSTRAISAAIDRSSLLPHRDFYFPAAREVLLQQGVRLIARLNCRKSRKGTPTSAEGATRERER